MPSLWPTFDEVDELVCSPGPVLLAASALITVTVGAAAGVVLAVVQLTAAACRRARA